MLVKLIEVIDQATGAEPSFRSVRPAIGEDEYFGAKEIGKWRAEAGARISPPWNERSHEFGVRDCEGTL